MNPFLLTVFALLLVLSPDLPARLVHQWTAAELWQKADCVVLAVPERVTDTGEGGTIRNAAGPALATVTHEATLRVVHVLKGNPPRSIVLRYAVLAPAQAPVVNGPLRLSLQPGAKYVLYLRQGAAPDQFLNALDGEFDDAAAAVQIGPSEMDPAGALPERVTNDIGMVLILVRPGELTVPVRERPSDMRRLKVETPFYLGQLEVTQEQWTRVMGTRHGTTLPVEMVTWVQGDEFCTRLSARGPGVYRLPTADEWEYACRAGNPAEFLFGPKAAGLSDHAWYGANAGDGTDERGNAKNGTTHPVGEKAANAWGFHDMLGNVNEWVADEFDAPAETRQRWAERSGRPADTPWRTYRGGCYYHDAVCCEASWWTFCPQTDRSPLVGLRVAMDVPAYVRPAPQAAP